MNASQYFPIKFYIHYKKGKICQGKCVFWNFADNIHNASEYNEGLGDSNGIRTRNHLVPKQTSIK